MLLKSVASLSVFTYRNDINIFPNYSTCTATSKVVRE